MCLDDDVFSNLPCFGCLLGVLIVKSWCFSRGTLLATAAVFLAVVSYPRAASAESNVNIYMGQACQFGGVLSLVLKGMVVATP